MSLIRKTHVPTTTIIIRVPIPVKADLVNLRKLAIKADIDFTATLAEAITTALKGIRSELEAMDRKPAAHANGAAAREG
jgi:hypothetical protein